VWQTNGIIEFPPPPAFQIVHYTKYSILERTVRFPYGYPDQPARLLEEILHFKKTAGNRPFEVLVTANIVYADADDTQFTVFFGQDYSLDDQRYCVGGPYVIRSLKDVRNINFFTPLNEISSLFERLFTETSDIYVYEVINIVFLLRTLVSDGSRPFAVQHGGKGARLRTEEEEKIKAEALKHILSRRVTRSQSEAQTVYQRRKGELLEFFSSQQRQPPDPDPDTP